MRHFSDHNGEMSNHQLILDQDMVEAFLSGRAAPADEFGFLAGFSEDLRVALNGAVPTPSSDLAVLLTTGLSDLVATGPCSATGTAWLEAGHPKSSKARTLVSGVAAKLVGVAAAAVIGAGAFGVLPASAQHAVATAISAVTPLQFPDPASNHAKVGANGIGGATGSAGQESPGLSRAGGTPVGGDAPAPPSGPNKGGVSTDLSRTSETPAAGPVTTTVEKPSSGGTDTGGGSTGLSRANETPAAGHVPTSVPGSNAGGGSTGQNRAAQTPAAGHVPSSVPGSNAGGGSTGQSRANQTPAAGHTPTSVGHH